MYIASDTRYDVMPYRRAGNSGLLLPLISIGCWQNFGNRNTLSTMQDILHTAFDNGITHFDLANNYGPPAGEAEINVGQILARDFRQYRHELCISTKAGYTMWPGPYGEWGSRKHLLNSLDQSLQRLQLDYVDVFYSHRPDPLTPIEETVGALATAVQSGKALYAGISSYSTEQTQKACSLLAELKVPCVLHQPKYNMLHRDIENGLLNTLEDHGTGCIVFSPLEQGLLTDKYLKNIPPDSRIARELGNGALTQDAMQDSVLHKIKNLHSLATTNGYTMVQLALKWILRDQRITSIIVGASSAAQLRDTLTVLQKDPLPQQVLSEIETILG